MTQPLRDSATPAARVSPGALVFDAEKLKSTITVAGLRGAQGITFRPLAFETTGALGRKARAGVRLLAAKLGFPRVHRRRPYTTGIFATSQCFTPRAMRRCLPGKAPSESERVQHAVHSSRYDTATEHAVPTSS